VSGDDHGNGRTIWGIARQAALPLTALLLGAASVALILDSSTGLPSPQSLGASSPAPSTPAQKIVVAPLTRVEPRRHRPAAPRASVASPVAPSSGAPRAVGGPAQQATAGGKKPTARSSGASAVGVLPTTSNPTTTQPTTTQPTATNPPPSYPTSIQRSTDQGDQGDQQQIRWSRHGRAVGRREHVPPGQAHQEHDGGMSRPAHGRRSDETGSDSQGHRSHGFGSDGRREGAHGWPGHAHSTHGSRSHGRGHEH
jgi:hypothetical protein